MKFCPRCEVEMARSEFVPNRHRHDGLSGYCRSCMAAYNRERERRLRAAVIALLGYECCGCGSTDQRVLDIDHIYGGGSAERRTTTRKQAVLYKHVLEQAGEGFQLLCRNCNWIKYIDPMGFVAPITETVTAG